MVPLVLIPWIIFYPREIKLAFKEVAKRIDGKEILKVTGGVPLQVRNLISCNFSIAKYEKDELCSILFSL